MPNTMFTVEFPNEIEKKLNKQLDFALVLTYTRLVQLAQTEIRNQLPGRFKTRNNFIKYGIRIEAATKRDPVATVYARMDAGYDLGFMLLQEKGGEKTPQNKHVAVPWSIRGKRVDRSPIPTVLKDKERPQYLLSTHEFRLEGKKWRVFKIDEETDKFGQRYRHDLPYGIYATPIGRKGRHDKGKDQLLMLYAFENQTDVDERFEFVQTAFDTATSQADAVFADSIKRAVATSR
jgi:hypothetical protein